MKALDLLMHQQLFTRQYGITSLKPEPSFGRNTHRWDDNVNMVLEGIWLESVNWLYLFKVWSTYRLLCNRCWTFGLLKRCQNVLNSWSSVSFWRRVPLFGVMLKYRVFHNVLRDYKNLLEENRRTRIYETCAGRRNNSKIFFPVSCFSS